MRNILALLFCLVLTACKSEIVPVIDNGIDTGKKVKIHMSVDETKKRETVLILNNCAGMNTPHSFNWAKQIIEWNYNAIVVDTFSPYGFSNICSGGMNSATHPYNSSKDIESIALWVKKQSWSNGKVAAIGFSLGANTGMLLATTPNSFEPKNIFSAIISYYPNCHSGYQERKLTSPFLVHVGEKDNWVNVNECKDMSTKTKFNNAEFYFYPDAEHGWDMGTTGSTPCWLGTCSWSYNYSADKKSRQITKDFLIKNFR